MNIVISQPMYLPWCGLINQIKLCDVYVHYDDVQLSRGFYNRIQVKRDNKIDFITVPIKNKKQKLLINEAVISYEDNWVLRHKNMLEESFKDSEYKNDAIEIFEKVHQLPSNNLSELAIKSITEICKYFDLFDGKEFIKSSDLNVLGQGSARLLEITKKLNGETYITGHGALNYLDHEIFQREKIEVRYMKYKINSYKQSYGDFTPYVTSLDAIASLGKKAIHVLDSSTISWEDALKTKNTLKNI